MDILYYLFLYSQVLATAWHISDDKKKKEFSKQNLIACDHKAKSHMVGMKTKFLCFSIQHVDGSLKCNQCVTCVFKYMNTITLMELVRCHPRKYESGVPGGSR